VDQKGATNAKTVTRLCSPALIVLACATAARAGSIAMLLDPYFRIQDALVDDRIDTIKADAALVAKGAAGLGDDGKGIVAAAAELERSDPSATRARVR
jgi:hypothetical protein